MINAQNSDSELFVVNRRKQRTARAWTPCGSSASWSCVWIFALVSPVIGWHVLQRFLNSWLDSSQFSLKVSYSVVIKCNMEVLLQRLHQWSTDLNNRCSEHYTVLLVHPARLQSVKKLFILCLSLKTAESRPKPCSSRLVLYGQPTPPYEVAAQEMLKKLPIYMHTCMSNCGWPSSLEVQENSVARWHRGWTAVYTPAFWNVPE